MSEDIKHHLLRLGILMFPDLNDLYPICKECAVLPIDYRQQPTINKSWHGGKVSEAWENANAVLM